MMDVRSEVAALFTGLSVPTYECIGFVGHVNASVIRCAAGSVTFERTRPEGRNLESKRQTDARWRERHYDAECERKKQYRDRPEVRERERVRSAARARLAKALRTQKSAAEADLAVAV
jgi:hypothetical protein